jgi:hypothetical protein
VRSRLPLLLALVAGSVVGPGLRRADACGNSVIFATDEHVRAVKRAESTLNDGSPAEAAALIQALKHKYFQIDRYTRPGAGNGSQGFLLANRALRVFSLACVRLGGAIGPWGPDQRRRNVEWATRILEDLTLIKPGDAASKTDYAEALAKTNASAAKPMLEELAAKDVLTTPYAYAVLAALRASSGDAAGRDEALARCKKMAAKASICEGPKPRP